MFLQRSLIIMVSVTHEFVVVCTLLFPSKLLKRTTPMQGCKLNVRLNLANVRAKVILIGHWSDHKKKIVTLYIFLL